ncbi:MAG: radical SAM protein [Oscillospiraceae bacterium]|nr:radical SAM protein [Oscillospiraceae bacterium]
MSEERQGGRVSLLRAGSEAQAEVSRSVRQKRTNASIFIPHLGCPHECSFCNKAAITQKENSVTRASVREILDRHVDTLRRKSMTAQIAFFGGTFTALDWDYREELLATANEYLREYPDLFIGIRCSTRPDYINEAVLTQLKRGNVTSVELGAQSMDDDVLRANNRGHDSAAVRTAAALIREQGFELGLQMMTGLYGDTPDKSLYTCDEIIKCAPATVRIYPTVVFRGTRLGELGHETFTLEQTVSLGAQIYGRFTEAGIRVIRIGLNPPPERFNPDDIIGSYSPIVGDLIMSRYFFERMAAFMQDSGAKRFQVCTDRVFMSKISGHKGENRTKLEQLGFTYKIKEKAGVELEIYAV